jgi:hypothetical protein
MSKKNYSVHWENEQAVSFEVDGVKYANLNDIPDKRDKRKLKEMMAASSEPDFDEKEWDDNQKESDKAQNIILWVFSGVAALMLLITVISASGAMSQIAKERSAPGQVVDVVMKREYINEQDRVVQEYYYPVVQFTANDSHRRVVQMSDGSDTPSYEKGDEVTVRYDPEHPLDARIDSFGSNALMWVLPSITGILGLAFLGAVLVVRWLTK